MWSPTHSNAPQGTQILSEDASRRPCRSPPNGWLLTVRVLPLRCGPSYLLPLFPTAPSVIPAQRLIRSIREEAGEGKRCLGLLDDPDPAATDKVIDVERAYQCFVRCVHTLQRIADPPPPGLGMTLTERAELYRLWSESMLLQFRACACPTCAETLSQVANMAHLQVSRLCAEAEVLIESSLDLAARPAVEVMMGSAGQAPGTVEGPNGARGALRYVSTSGVELGDVGELLRPPRVPAGLEAGGRESATATAEWCGVGVNLARIVGAHVAVLLGVDCARSPTPASLACAQQCLTQWRKLSSQGLTRIAGLPSATATEVQSLEKWARRAHATIRIAEAAAGGMRPADSVEAALSSALEVTPDGGGGEGGARVVRVVQAPSRTWVEAVERALDYHGRHADAEVVDVVGEGVKSARRELEVSRSGLPGGAHAITSSSGLAYPAGVAFWSRARCDYGSLALTPGSLTLTRATRTQDPPRRSKKSSCSSRARTRASGTSGQSSWRTWWRRRGPSRGSRAYERWRGCSWISAKSPKRRCATSGGPWRPR